MAPNNSGRKSCTTSRARSSIELWQLHSTILSSSEFDLDILKHIAHCAKSGRCDSSESSPASTTDASYSEETCDSDTPSSSDGECTSKLCIGSSGVPKLSLPTLYEDEENPVTVKITCKKCLHMETILRNFAEMHVKAFETCKEKRFKFWEYITNWNSKLQKSLEQIKTHLIGEFIVHIEQTPLSEFKEDHDFRVQFNHYRLLFTHMRSMEDRFNKRMEELKCPLRDSFNLEVTDKILKDIRLKINSSSNALNKLEQRIRCIAKSWDSARVETNPHGFRQAIFTKEDYIFNRLSNIFTCIEFLEKERMFYEEKAREESNPTPIQKPKKKLVLPPIELKPRRDESQCPKPSNVKRLPQNSVKRKLPSTIAHFYPFTITRHMGDIHASWYKTFLKSDDVRKEINQQRETNMRVLTDIKQLKKEINQLEIQLKMKEYVEKTVKGGESAEESFIIFPDKEKTSLTSQPTQTFLDFNDLF